MGPAVICVTGLKLLRSSFSDSSRQHLVLLWTVLFFHFDYRHSSETFVVDYFFMSIFMNKVWTIHKGSPIQSDCQTDRQPHSQTARQKEARIASGEITKVHGWGGLGFVSFARVYYVVFIIKVVPSYLKYNYFNGRKAKSVCFLYLLCYF